MKLNFGYLMKIGCVGSRPKIVQQFSNNLYGLILNREKYVTTITYLNERKVGGFCMTD